MGPNVANKFDKNIKFKQHATESKPLQLASMEDMEDDSDFDKNYDGFYDDEDDESVSVTLKHHHVITPITPITPMTPEKHHGFKSFNSNKSKYKMPGLKMIASEFSTEWSVQDLAFLDDVKDDEEETSKLSLSNITPMYRAQTSTPKHPIPSICSLGLSNSVTTNSIMLTLNPNVSNSSMSQRSDTATPVSFKSHGFSPTVLYSMVSDQFPHTGGHSGHGHSNGRISSSLSTQTRSSSLTMSSNEATKRVITRPKYKSKLLDRAHRKQMKVSG